MAFITRIKYELAQMKNMESNNIYSLQPTSNLHEWKGSIVGPEDSLYSGRTFELHIMLPSNYPITAPIVKFITPIKHVNVNTHGDICLDILKNEWKPTHNLMSIMMSVFYLLMQPNFDDAFNDELVQLYRNDKRAYEKAIQNCS